MLRKYVGVRDGLFRWEVLDMMTADCIADVVVAACQMLLV